MAPPTRLDTINARLDLVDSFLEDEQFFYEVMDQLVSLPDVEKMLAHMALVPKQRGGRNGAGAGFAGGKRQVTARLASKGISALVCIKSALSVIPNFARVIEIQLKTLMKRDRKKSKNDGENSNRSGKQPTGSTNDDDSDDDSGSESSSSFSSDSDDDTLGNIVDDEESDTNISSLLLGLGSGPRKQMHCAGSNSKNGNHSHKYQLLRSILFVMKNPMLKEILDAVMDIFTESTTYSKNSHAMRHQECFALKPNTDGMMVSDDFCSNLALLFTMI